MPAGSLRTIHLTRNLVQNELEFSGKSQRPPIIMKPDRIYHHSGIKPLRHSVIRVTFKIFLRVGRNDPTFWGVEKGLMVGKMRESTEKQLTSRSSTQAQKSHVHSILSYHKTPAQPAVIKR